MPERFFKTDATGSSLGNPAKPGGSARQPAAPGRRIRGRLSQFSDSQARTATAERAGFRCRKTQLYSGQKPPRKRGRRVSKVLSRRRDTGRASRGPGGPFWGQKSLAATSYPAFPGALPRMSWACLGVVTVPCLSRFLKAQLPFFAFFPGRQTQPCSTLQMSKKRERHDTISFRPTAGHPCLFSVDHCRRSGACAGGRSRQSQGRRAHRPAPAPALRAGPPD